MVRALRSALLMLALVVAATLGAGRVAAGETPVPHPAKAQGEKCVADTDVMRRNHMHMLKHQRGETVHGGVRTPQFSLNGCISCHVVNGSDGKPVSYEDPKHFCRSCHTYAAVAPDCFECHASRPPPPVKSSAAGQDKDVAALTKYLGEVKP